MDKFELEFMELQKGSCMGYPVKVSDLYTIITKYRGVLPWRTTEEDIDGVSHRVVPPIYEILITIQRGYND